MSTRAVIIGCSAGGLEALETILRVLPPTFAAPVVVVQHQAPGHFSALAELLARHCRLPVKEVDEKEPALPGHVYTAPPDYHLLIESDRTFALSVDEEINHSRPSIDVSFDAFREVYGADLIAVLLTGADADGAQGSRRIQEAGGRVVIQDPETALVATMPEAAIAATRGATILPLSDIGAYLVSQMESEGIVS